MYPMMGEMENVMAASRIYAIACRHEFIDFVHLFGGLLSCECSAGNKLSSFSEKQWKEIVERLYEQSEDSVEKDSFPLTVKAEDMILISSSYAKQTKSKRISSDHLLLALLSTNNLVTQEVKKAGVVFEDINEQAFPDKKIAKRTGFTLLPKKSNYSSFEKWFMSKDSIKGKLDMWHNVVIEFYEAEDYDQCIKACKIARSLSTANPAFDILEAYSYYSQRNFETAIPLLLQLIEKSPEESDFKIALASAYDEIENYSEAAKINYELLRSQPSNAILLNNTGFNLQLQERFADAVPYYQSAIDTKPSFAYPYDNLGFCKYKLGEYDEAIELIDKSLELDKGNAYAYKYKGIIFMENNNKEEALKNFKLALKFGYTKTYGNAVNEYLKKLG